MSLTTKREKRIRRHERVRARVRGTSERPRISVFRSHKHIYAQLIDDEKGMTIASSSNGVGEGRKKNMVSRAQKVGEELAVAAKAKRVSRAVFDRGGRAYHGAVKAVADGARKGGLKF